MEIFAIFVFVHIYTPRENNRLLDYYKIISISRPILALVNMGLDFVSGQYGCLFSRCRKYVINSLIHVADWPKQHFLNSTSEWVYLACSEYTSREVYSGLCLFLSIVYSVFQRCPTRDEISLDRNSTMEYDVSKNKLTMWGESKLI
jgi:hypothetical protein